MSTPSADCSRFPQSTPLDTGPYQRLLLSVFEVILRQTQVSFKEMARADASRSKKPRNEDTSSESDDPRTSHRRRQKPPPRRTKKRKDDSSEEESSDSGKKKRKEDSSDAESSDNGEGSPADNSNSPDSSSSEESPSPPRKAPRHRANIGDSSEESDGEPSSEEEKPQRRRPISPHRRTERLQKEAGPKSRPRRDLISPASSDIDESRPRNYRALPPPVTSIQSEDDQVEQGPSSPRVRGGGGLPKTSAPISGGRDKSLSPPPGNEDDGEDDLARAFAASKLEKKKNQDAREKVKKAGEEEMRKVMAASKHTAAKTSRDTEDAEKEEMRKALEASKSTVQDRPLASQDNEEEIRRAIELSVLDSHPPALQDASDNEDYKKLLEVSVKEAAEHAQKLKEAREGKKRAKEVIEESKRTVQDDKRKRLEIAKLADQDYEKKKKEAVWENIAEYKAKKLNRQKALAYKKKRDKEIVEEERERIRLEREQLARANGQDASGMRDSGQRSGGRYGGRPGGLQPVLDEMTPEEAEQLRQAEALSLGDQGPGSTPTVTEVGWCIEKMPPSYPDINRRENRKILDPNLWTTSTRDIAQPGERIPMTPELKNEMIQHGARTNVMYGERNESPDAPKPPKYKRTGKKEEKKALAAIIKPSKPTHKTKATEIVDNQVRGNPERDYGHRMAPQMYGDMGVARMDHETRRQTREAQIQGNRNAFRNNPISRLF